MSITSNTNELNEILNMVNMLDGGGSDGSGGGGGSSVVQNTFQSSYSSSTQFSANRMSGGSGKSVTCGFQPDVVVFYGSAGYTDSEGAKGFDTAALAFDKKARPSISSEYICTYLQVDSQGTIVSIAGEATSTGFTVWTYEVEDWSTYSGYLYYIAYKFNYAN